MADEPKPKSAAAKAAATKDIIAQEPTPVSGQYGTNEAVVKQGEKVKARNSEADLAGGSYATTGLAAPLTPSDQHTQVVPVLGDPQSSTSHIPAAAGLKVQVGEQHNSLVDEDGNTLGADDLFEDPGAEKTYLVVKQRVMERFTYPNTTEVTTRLFYAKGRHIGRTEAERLKTAIRLQEEYGI